jgi:hypothetical protein
VYVALGNLRKGVAPIYRRQCRVDPSVDECPLGTGSGHSIIT